MVLILREPQSSEGSRCTVTTQSVKNQGRPMITVLVNMEDPCVIHWESQDGFHRKIFEPRLEGEMNRKPWASLRSLAFSL